MLLAIIAYSRVLFPAGRLSLGRAPVFINYKREKKDIFRIHQRSKRFGFGIPVKTIQKVQFVASLYLSYFSLTNIFTQMARHIKCF